VRRLVLVHGVGVSPRYFRRLIAALDGFDVEAPDLREQIGLAARAEALASVVGAAPAVLLGNSYGCQIALELAVRRPELVRCAIFVGPTTDSEHRSWPQYAGRLALDAFRERPGLLPLIFADYLRTGPLRVLRMARESLADAPERKLPSLAAPLLVVRGERDPLCPQPWAEELTGLAPHARLEVLEGAGHAAHDSHPGELAALVRGFVEKTQ
jgi:pimeloyl-ACP methyl ester carboxylesterase